MRFHRFHSFLTLCGLLSHLPLTAQADFTPAQPLIEALTAKAEAAAGSDGLSKRADMELALARHIDEVQNKGGDVDKELGDGNTALMLAVALGEREAARYLLLFGADPNKKNAEGKCALDLAWDDAMRTLLKEEAPLTTWEEADAAFNTFADTLSAAFGNKNNAINAWQKAANDKRAESCYAAIRLLALEDGSSRLVSFLMRQARPSRPKDAAAWWFNLLEHERLAYICNQEEIRRLLALITSYSSCMNGADVDELTMTMAAHEGYDDFFRVMVQRGADPLKGKTHQLPGTPPITVWPINCAVNGGHKEIAEFIFSQHTFPQEKLDELLTEACSSLNSHSAEMENFLLEKGARYSRQCLLKGLHSRDEAWMVKVCESLNITNKAELTQLLVQIVASPVCTPGSSPVYGTSRTALIEKLVKDGADVHALERMPRGMKTHPLFTLFSEGFQQRQDCYVHLDVYETLLHLGMNEKTVLHLPMTRRGNSLFAANPAWCSFLAERALAHSWKTPRWLKDMGDTTEAAIMQGKSLKGKKGLNYDTMKALSVGAITLTEKLLAQGANLEEACTRDEEFILFVLTHKGSVKRCNRIYQGQHHLRKMTQEATLPSNRGKAQYETYRLPELQKMSLRADHALCTLIKTFRQERSRKTLEYLVNKGVDMKKVLNIPIDPRRSRTTLLMYAAMDSLMGFPLIDAPVSPEALEWLLAHGADPMAKDCDGNTALDFATDEKKKALLRAAMEKAQKR